MALVTNYGFAETAKLLASTPGTPFNYLALGYGSYTENVTINSLQSELTSQGLVRTSVAGSVASSAVASDTACWSATWTATASQNVKEAGVLNSSAAGALLCYGTFTSAIPMESADTLQVTWSVNCKAG